MVVRAGGCAMAGIIFTFISYFYALGFFMLFSYFNVLWQTFFHTFFGIH